jgi:predicted nuclease with TOPRIM domain
VDAASRSELNELISKKAALEQKDKDNENRFKQLENDNKLLQDKVKNLEEKPRNGVLEWTKLFDKKNYKSTEEI